MIRKIPDAEIGYSPGVKIMLGLLAIAWLASAPSTQAAGPEGAECRYIVQSGDTLSGIALTRELGPWQKLYAANREAIGDNPNLIHPGVELNVCSELKPATRQVTAEQKTPQRDGQSLDQAKFITKGEDLVFLPSSRTWIILGKEDQNKIKFTYNLVDAPDLKDPRDENFSVLIYSSEKFPAIRNSDEPPAPVGRTSPNNLEHVDGLYDGGHGKGEAWVALVVNKTTAPVKIHVVELSTRAGECTDKITGTYRERIGTELVDWTTCNENWLGIGDRKN